MRARPKTAKEMVRKLEEELSEEDDSEEDEEEDEAGMLDPLAEDQFLRILPLLAKKDKKIYDKNLTFFPPKPEASPQGNSSLLFFFRVCALLTSSRPHAPP